MKITLAAVRPASARKNALEPLVQDYLKRTTCMAAAATVDQPSEERLLTWCDTESAQGATYSIFLEGRGQQQSSEQFAGTLARQRDAGKRHIILAIGPPDGWSAAARARAGLLLSFGPITLPHELARLVLAEQIYRACTIEAGHPYHCGH